MHSHFVEPSGRTVSGDERTPRWSPVDVPLDENPPPSRRAAARAQRTGPRSGPARWRPMAVFAIGLLAGGVLAHGLAAPHGPPVPAAAPAAPSSIPEPHDVPPRSFTPSTGEAVNDLLTNLDVLTETLVADTLATAEPGRGAAVHSLRQQRTEVRDLIITYFFGWLPVSVP